MPYQPRHPRQPTTTKTTVRGGFTRADGTRNTQDSFTQWTGMTPDADLDDIVVHEKTELSCGCYWPDAKISGVCAVCAEDKANPNVCRAHHVVCKCGTSCCWKHSRLQDDGTTRLCISCHIRAENKAMKAAVVGAVVRWARRVLIDQTQNPPTPE